MITKIQTNNPIMDNLIYYLKILVDGCILKSEDQSLADETLESIKASDLYIACIENKIIFEMFVYDMDMLLAVSVPVSILDECVADQTLIPEQYKAPLLLLAKNSCIDNYVELNNYYRMLSGLPANGEVGIKISKPFEYVDINKCVSDMTDSEINILISAGVIDDLIAQYPGKKYLTFIRNGKIDIYTARKAQRFGLLYIPNIESAVILEKFRRKLELNRTYVLKTMYTEAMKFNSDYYDNFIEIFIKILTMVNVIIELPETLIRRDFFDLRSINDMFESHGINHFSDIPKKYQLAMIKNLNTLIKFKSTNRNIVDICSIFGFTNIDIFKYYILKDRKVDLNGDFVFNFKDDPANPGNQILDDDKNYELKFIKVPLEAHIDEYMRDPNNQTEYDDMTIGDIYWNGDQPAEVVKSQIINKEFTVLKSKYMSIDTIYDMSKLSFETSYFFNMVFSNSGLEENLKLKVKCIDSDKYFKLFDIISYLYLLTYEMININDTILDTTSKILHVNGFNFSVDLAALSVYVKSKGYTMESLGISDFQKPVSNVLSYNQMLDIFTRNKNIYKHVVDQMINADSIDIYRIYKHIYDALMTTKLNNSIFKKADGSFAGTYTNFLKDRDVMIYNHILDIRTNAGVDKNSMVVETISDILLALEDYIDTTNFSFLFSKIPSLSDDLIKSYIFKVISFFKSYKIDLASINIIYKFDDRLENKVHILEKVLFEAATFNKVERIAIVEKFIELVYTEKLDNINISDKLFLDICKSTKDPVTIIEKITALISVNDKDLVDFHFKEKYLNTSCITNKDAAIPSEFVFISTY